MEMHPLIVHHKSLEFSQMMDSFREERARTQSTLLVLTGMPRPELRSAAEEMASELGRPLQHIDLGAVAEKYIGETEKNLRETFARATADDAILFFDEADALFGKRTEVKDGHERYTDVVGSHLLQTISQYPGITIALVQSPFDAERKWPHAKLVIVKFPHH
jgi:SpoVK/Ycf46/Vps4 family AAA+-type ATPase